MKLADVTCDAKSRRSTHRLPSGRKYLFRSGQSTEVTELEDARYFEDQVGYTVDWTARGRFVSQIAGSDDSVAEALESFGYRAKQELAKTVGVAANQSEEELDEELQEAAEDLKQQMENY